MAAASTALSATSGAGNAYVQSKALKAQGDYQLQVANLNAKMAEAQAKDAEARGKTAVTSADAANRKALGAQRAAIAANGGDLTSEDNMALLQETNMVGQEEQLKIMNNAWREAWGYKAEAINTRAEGEQARNTNYLAARTTLISGITQAGAGAAATSGEASKAKAGVK